MHGTMNLKKVHIINQIFQTHKIDADVNFIKYVNYHIAYPLVNISFNIRLFVAR